MSKTIMFCVAFCLLFVPAALSQTVRPFGSPPQAVLKLDQSNYVTSPEGLGLGNGLYGQTFKPGEKVKNVAQVDLLLTVNNVPSDGVDTEVGIYTNITQEPIAAVIVHVAPPDVSVGEIKRTVSYRFDPPVPLRKGTMYTIGFYAQGNVWWQFAYGDNYPRGEMVDYQGAPSNPPGDFVFATYELVKK